MSKRKSPSQKKATLKWLERQRSKNRISNNYAARVSDELRRQREQTEYETRKGKTV